MGKMITVAKDLGKQIGEADVTGLSAQLAYFFLLSLFPFLLFLVTLLGFVPVDTESFLGYLDQFLPKEVMELIDTNLQAIVNNRSGGLLSAGVIGTLWSASNGFNALTKSFNKAYQVEEDRSFIINRLLSLGLVVGLVVVIIVALVGSVFGKVIGEHVFGLIGLSNLIDSWNIIRWVITTLVFLGVLWMMYVLAPNEKIRGKEAIPGAVFATVVWQVASLGFAFYVNNLGNYSATYGSLGAVIILMIWFYLSGIIITTGGVINAYLMRKRGRKDVGLPVES